MPNRPSAHRAGRRVCARSWPKGISGLPENRETAAATGRKSAYPSPIDCPAVATSPGACFRAAEANGRTLPKAGEVTGSGVAPCCPDVATHKGMPLRGNCHGFDHRTNPVNMAETGECWMRRSGPRRSRRPRRRKMVRAGSWLLSGRKQTCTSFGGRTAAYRPNCCAVAPTNVAQVTTKPIPRCDVAVKIRGRADGEASLTVNCKGQPTCWFHNWCRQRATIIVAIGAIKTDRATPPADDAVAIETLLTDPAPIPSDGFKRDVVRQRPDTASGRV